MIEAELQFCIAYCT